MFAAAPYDNPQLWELVNNLIVVLGLATPFVLLGWGTAWWINKNLATKEALQEAVKELKSELEQFKKSVEQRSYTDGARYDKLEQEYLELLRVLANPKVPKKH